MDVVTETGKFYTCKNCLSWGLSQGFSPCQQNRLRALVPGWVPRPNLWSQPFPGSYAPSSRGQQTGHLFAFTLPELAAQHCSISNTDVKVIDQAGRCRTDLLQDASGEGSAAPSCEGSNCICHHDCLQQGTQISPNLHPQLLQGLLAAPHAAVGVADHHLADPRDYAHTLMVSFRHTRRKLKKV